MTQHVLSRLLLKQGRWVNGMTAATRGRGQASNLHCDPLRLSYQKDFHVPFQQIKGTLEIMVFYLHFYLGLGKHS